MKLTPNAMGTPAERAAFDLVYYFKLVTNKSLAPAELGDAAVRQIVGIVENVIDAAVKETMLYWFDCLRVLGVLKKNPDNFEVAIAEMIAHFEGEIEDGTDTELVEIPDPRPGRDGGGEHDEK